MAADTIPARLFARAAANPDGAAMHSKEGGQWRTLTWSAYAAEVRAAARTLIQWGLQPGDRTCVLGFNREEWVVFDVATMVAGGAPAGIYTTCSPVEVAYIVDHAEARFILVEDLGQWQKIVDQRSALPALEKVVFMRGVDLPDDPIAVSWQAFISGQDSAEADAEVDARVEALKPDDMATFIYTSGTTGPPKAVVLTHENLAWTSGAAHRIAGLHADDCTVSYLPLSHIAEQMFTIHAPITAGSQVYFAESLDRLPDNLKEVQPTVIFGVPRIWEKMHAKVSARLSEATGVKAALAGWAMRVGRAHIAALNAGNTPSAWLSLQHRVASRLIYDKVKPVMGLGRARFCVSGAAPISAEILEFFSGLDIPIREVYGQSEDSGPTSFNLPGRTKFGSVGPAIEGTEVTIAQDGEILVRGPHVFAGYFKNPEATAETLVDGWLHSGDLGRFDDAGFLHITGRKKEIIITAGGKNIAPKNIEAALRDLPLVAQAVVIGDRRRFLSALITLDPEANAAWAAEHGADAATLHDNAALRAELQDAVDKLVNAQFARVEQVRRFAILPRDFSIDEGELTPTLKIKRSVVARNWSTTIESMYADGAADG